MNVSNDDETMARLRTEYEGPALLEPQLASDPISQFHRWFDEAVAADTIEPNAMVLGTVDEAGRPRQRTVLLKHVDQAGFTFFTNYESAKATDIAGQSWVSLLFGWYGMHRQVIVSGRAARVPEADSDRYFASRPHGSQLAVWASRQSQVIEDRKVLDSAYARLGREYPGEVPRPSRWGGFTVVPQQVEFWQGRTNRLHDRLRFSRDREDAWVVHRLAPLANKLGSLLTRLSACGPRGMSQTAGCPHGRSRGGETPR